MSDVMAWIKANMREGANLAEAEELVMRGSIDGIDTKDRALELLYNQKLLKAAFDSEISKKVANHDERFISEKLPSMLEAEREKIRRELNPQETPEQKELREVKEQMLKFKREKEMADLRDKLRIRAKELDYDPDRAAKLAILGDYDKANEMIEDQASYLQKALDAERTKLVNTGLGGPPPSGGDTDFDSLTVEAIESMTLGEIEGKFK